MKCFRCRRPALLIQGVYLNGTLRIKPGRSTVFWCRDCSQRAAFKEERRDRARIAAAVRAGRYEDITMPNGEVQRWYRIGQRPRQRA